MGASKELFNEERENEFLNDIHEPKSELKKLNLFSELEHMIQRVNEGYENELEMFCFFSDAEKAFKLAKDKILDAALKEREKYDEKTVSVYGKKISFQQSGKFYYDENDTWNNQKKKLDEIQELMKQSYHSASKGVVMVDENGEVIPAAKYVANKKSLKIV